MPEPPEPMGSARREPAGGLELLRFTASLSAASSVGDLARRFRAAFPPLFGVPMYGLYVIDPWTGDPEIVARANVSDYFLARYDQQGREVDSLHAHLRATGRAAYNLELMSMEEWLEHPLYRRVKRLHELTQEIQTPVVTKDGIVGNINFGTSDPCRGFTSHEVHLAEALGRVVGTAVERIHYTESVERERDQARVALELLGAAVVISDAWEAPRLNDAARRLLAEVVDGEVQLHRVIARSAADAGFSRHLPVELVGGGSGFLHGHSTSLDRHGDALMTVLELERDGGEISERTLVALTPREREVALRVVEGLSDREIAERLWLSPHTVRQYVKRIYRKLDVDSRVALTRLLLGLSNSSPDG
jgi:DNA-binding CsgD family transcriptional regulator/GAF domain-containing protein